MTATAAPCTHHLWDDPTALTCVLTGAHLGHRYEASDGSWVAECAKEEL